MRGRRESFSACLANGDSAGFGFLLSSSPSEPTTPVFGDHFSLPDFLSDRLRTPSIAEYGTDRGPPVRGGAVVRVVVK